ncbi:hypothetical protein ACLB2K_005741 [Fragaria x ananassa]
MNMTTQKKSFRADTGEKECRECLQDTSTLQSEKEPGLYLRSTTLYHLLRLRVMPLTARSSRPLLLLSTKKSMSEDVKNSSFRSTDSVGSVSSRRRGPVSPHELHYTVNRAVTEEMRRKTVLPYKHGLLGCLGFNHGLHEISRVRFSSVWPPFEVPLVSFDSHGCPLHFWSSPACHLAAPLRLSRQKTGDFDGDFSDS